MRSSHCSKCSDKKKPCSYRVKKKKKSFNKSRGMWGGNFDISTSYLDNINEVLRINKRQQAEGKGLWKIVPKDSCEVYKDRQKRRIDNERNDDANSFCDECLDDDDKRHEATRPRGKNVKKKRPQRKGPSQTRKKRKPRYHRDSSGSVSSCEYTPSQSCSSMSYTSVTDFDE